MDNHLNDMTSLGEHYRAGRKEEARRIAHSLKGASGTLGAVVVRSLAAELEAAIHDGASDADVLSLSIHVEQALAQLVFALRVALPEAESAAPVGEVPCESITRLEHLLREDDMGAGNALREARPCLARYLSSETLARLNHQVEAYEFQDALETLRAAKLESMP
jgi:two-component system sensor histidine kinase/response regulator